MEKTSIERLNSDEVYKAYGLTNPSDFIEGIMASGRVTSVLDLQFELEADSTEALFEYMSKVASMTYDETVTTEDARRISNEHDQDVITAWKELYGED